MSIKSREAAVALAALMVVGISAPTLATHDGLVNVSIEGRGLISDIGVEEAAHIWAGICDTDYDAALVAVSSVDGRPSFAISCIAPVRISVSDNFGTR